VELKQAADRIQKFECGGLTERLASLESHFASLGARETAALCSSEELDAGLLEAAVSLKRIAGQINVIIHATGILIALPAVLSDGEVVQRLSLGAGNTGRQFDLETNRRIAEFKFINWRGGPEVIRQNALFKDFFGLAEHETSKLRCLYVLGLDHPLKFFTGRRALSSIMSRNSRLARSFADRYGDRFKVVREYFEYRKGQVQIIDLLPLLPQLADLARDS